ncbi:MAG: hypothetical protein FJX71_00950 [Alphaproteobacteria bacterium]|nr:hypothetical protein [Alphaproteobacteria bacterium]
MKYSDLKADSKELNDVKLYLENRWKEAYQINTGYSNQGVSYLTYGHSGGIAVMLGFIGASEWASKVDWMIYSLICFSFGFLLVGCFLLFMYFKTLCDFKKFKQDRWNFLSGEMDYEKLINSDNERISKSHKYGVCIAIACFILLILGIIFSCRGFYVHLA